jgi:eukaryotic-like serine/threonine-protein kinase
VSPRITARAPRERWKLPLEGRGLLLLVVGVGLTAFVVGFGLTALAFTRGRAPADVVMVPDLRDVQLAEARRRLSAGGLQLEVGDSFPNPNIPPGAILAQTPLPGQEVSPGAQVTVIVSTGQLRPTVPDVEAMPVILATRTLQTAGFDVLVEEAVGEGQPGRVVSVSPAAGTPVTLPATVVVRVGAALPETAIPTVIGMREEAAKQTIEAAGFVVGEIVYVESEFGEPGGVVSQEPAPGSSAPSGAHIRLQVNFPAGTTSLQPGARERRPLMVWSSIARRER